jgi:hypothetical protein
MDYETTIECYRELRDDASYREEAIDLLIDEVNNSPILADSEKAELLIALDEIRKQQAFGESATVKRFWSILLRNVSFVCEIMKRRCLGERYL